MAQKGPGRIYEVAERQRAALLRRERAAAGELVRAYGGIWQRLKGELGRLLDLRAEAARRGEAVGPGWLFQFNRLERLLDQVETELRAYAEFAEALIVEQERAAVAAAQADAAAQVAAAGWRGSWSTLPNGALQDLIGFTAAGSPLRELLERLGPEMGAAVRDALIQGLALGHNPERIARAVREGFAGGLSQALRVCRTEVLRAYREATRRAYEANDDVVEGWIWNSALTARTCAFCWAMHGSVHPLSERLTDHPHGRCTMLPLTKDLPGMTPQVRPDPGPAQFAKLPAAEQRAILGPGAYAAYRAGAIELQDLAGWSHSADWGRTPRVKSLRELVGAEEAKRWAQVARQELTARQALGADLNTLLRLRETRLAELSATASAEIESVLHGMQAARRLPKLDYHFEQHGAELGAATPDELNALFLAHIRRQDLRCATAIRGKDGARMWYLVDVDSGLVAQYNATRRRYFSFFRVQDQEQFERNYALSWVEAIRQGEQWTFRAWLT